VCSARKGAPYAPSSPSLSHSRIMRMALPMYCTIDNNLISNRRGSPWGRSCFWKNLILCIVPNPTTRVQLPPSTSYSRQPVQQKIYAFDTGRNLFLVRVLSLLGVRRWQKCCPEVCSNGFVLSMPPRPAYSLPLVFSAYCLNPNIGDNHVDCLLE
jgi:hypothetical protein